MSGVGDDAHMTHRALRVFTANIYNYAADYERRAPVLRDALLALDADVLAFQEAGRKESGPHQVEELLAGTGFHIHHQFDGRAGPGTLDGVCVASRWPMSHVETLALLRNKRTGSYPWAALMVTIHAPAPIGDFLFVNAKPCWQLHLEAERERQLVDLVGAIERRAERKNFPTVIAGDFDAAPDRSSIRFITGRQSLAGVSTQYLDTWEMAGDGSAGFTWSTRNPLVSEIATRWTGQEAHHRRIDYIFVASAFLTDRPAVVKSCRVVLDTPVNGVWPSDHFGVLADIAPIA